MKQKRFIPSQRIKGSGKELFIINYEGSVLEIQRTSNLYEPLIIRFDGELLETVPSKQNKEIEFSTAEGKHTLQVWNERVENNLIPKIFVKDGIAIVIDGIPVKNSLADPMSRFGSAQAFIWLLTILLFIKAFVIPLINIEGIKESQILIIVFLYIILFILTLSAALTFKLNPLRSTWIALVISIIESAEFFYTVAVAREFSILIFLFAILRLSIIAALIFSLRNLKHILSYEQDEVKSIKPDYGLEKKKFWNKFSFKPKYVIIVLAALLIVSGIYYAVTKFIESSNIPSIERDSALEFRSDLKLPDLIPYRKGDKWGYANNKGEIVVKPEYTEVEFPSKNNFFSVEKDSLVGILNRQGKEIIPCLYKKIEEPSIGNLFIAKNMEGKRGVVDEDNNVIIPFEYSSLKKHPSRDLFIATKNAMQGVIGEKNKIIIPFNYKNVSYEFLPDTFREESGLEFCDDFLIAKKSINGKTYYGLLNFDGSLLLDFQPLRLKKNENLSNDLLEATRKISAYSRFDSKFEAVDEIGIIDKYGKIILPIEYSEFYSNSRSENNFIQITKGSVEYYPYEHKSGVINSDGKLLVPCEYDWIYLERSNDRYIIVKKYYNDSGFYGVFDTWTGSEKIPTRYDYLNLFKQDDNYFFAIKDKNKNKVGLLDEYMNVVIPFEYDYLYMLNKDWIIVIKNARKGARSIQKVILPIEYMNIYSLSDDLALVKYVEPDSISRIINSAPIKNTEFIREIQQGLLFGIDFYLDISMNPEYAYKNYTPVELLNVLSDTTSRRKFYEQNADYLTTSFSNYEGFSLALAVGGHWSNTPGKWGYFNEKGEQVIDFLYEDAESFENGFARVWFNDKIGVINTQGVVVIPIRFENLIRVEEYDLFEISNKDYKTVGYIDANGVKYFEE